MPTSAISRVVLGLCLTCLPLRVAAQPSGIAVNEVGDGFVLSATGVPFVPWGFNYSRDDRFRLLESLNVFQSLNPNR
jgi:hypothetical protein